MKTLPDSEKAAPEKPGNGATPISSFEELSKISNAPGTFKFEMRGQPYSLNFRPLSSDEAEELNKIDGRIIAPRDPATKELNLEDPIYKRNLDHARRQKRTATFNLALLSFKIPGDNLEAQTKQLYQLLPPGVIDELWLQIYKLTSSPIENGLFDYSAGSP